MVDVEFKKEIYFAKGKAEALFYLTGNGDFFAKEIFNIKSSPQNWVPEI